MDGVRLECLDWCMYLDVCMYGIKIEDEHALREKGERMLVSGTGTLADGTTMLGGKKFAQYYTYSMYRYIGTVQTMKHKGCTPTTSVRAQKAMDIHLSRHIPLREPM